MKTLFITLNGLRLLSRRPTWLVFTIFAPLTFTFVLGLTLTGDAGKDPRLPVVVVDLDGSTVSGDIVDQIGQSAVVRLGERADEAGARRAVTAQTARAALILPAGLGQAVAGGQEAQVTFLADQTSPTRIAVEQELTAILGRVASAYDVARVAVAQAIVHRPFDSDAQQVTYQATALDRARALLAQPGITVSEIEGVTHTARPVMASGFNQSSAGSAVHWVLFGALSTTGFIVDERKRGTLRRLMVMPLQRGHILAGTMLMGFLVALLQISVLATFGTLFGADWGKDVVALALVSVCFALSMAGLAMLFASIVRTRGQAVSTGIALSTVAAPLAGAWFPRELLPRVMLDLGKLFPSGWAMEAYSGVIVRNYHVANVLLPCGIMLVFAAVFLALGVRRFTFE